MRAVPPAALALLKQFEGKDGTFEAVPTQDPVGNWEIGWGHKLSGPGPEPAFPGSPLDEAAADALALQDLANVGAYIERWVNGTAAWTDNQWAAVLCFAYNEGAPEFVQSTMCGLMERGFMSAAADEFPKWVWAHQNGQAVKLDGLIRRRAAERALFLS